MTGHNIQQLGLFGVTLTDEQVEELLLCIHEPEEYLDAIRVLRTAGWPSIERSIPGFIARLPRDMPKLQALLEITDSHFGRPPYPVAELVIDTAIEEQEVGFLNDDLAAHLVDIGADRTKLGILLDNTVRAAARDFEFGGLRPPEFGEVFPELGTWLKHIAPLVYPDVRARFRWFLSHVCEYITDVSENQQFVLYDPVQEWLGNAGAHQEEIDRMLVASVDRWVPVLGWDEMELAVLDARARLGLPNPDEEEEAQTRNP